MMARFVSLLVMFVFLLFPEKAIASSGKGERLASRLENRHNCRMAKPKRALKLIDSMVVDPTNYLGSNSRIELKKNKCYLFEVNGTFSNRNGREFADAEYVTEDGWLTKVDGLFGWPLNDYWNELDLMVDGNFVDWQEKEPQIPNTYRYTYRGTGNTVNLMVFDGSPDLKLINPGWYSDNIGSLTVKIYRL